MNLTVAREPSTPAGTVGALTLDGQIGRLAYTLEDPVREVPGEPVSSWKIQNETAIPVGRYRVAINWSARFARRMPILLEVPGFTGIRIHPGNTAKDTDGCILVGLSREGSMVLHSKAAFVPLYDRIETALLATEEVWLSVKGGNP